MDEKVVYWDMYDGLHHAYDYLNWVSTHLSWALDACYRGLYINGNAHKHEELERLRDIIDDKANYINDVLLPSVIAKLEEPDE